MLFKVGQDASRSQWQISSLGTAFRCKRLGCSTNMLSCPRWLVYLKYHKIQTRPVHLYGEVLFLDGYAARRYSDITDFDLFRCHSYYSDFKTGSLQKQGQMQTLCVQIFSAPDLQTDCYSVSQICLPCKQQSLKYSITMTSWISANPMFALRAMLGVKLWMRILSE